MDISERKVAEEAIRRSEAFLAEAQKLSHTGSFGWKVSSGEIFWSDETFRIFECDLKTKPTLEFVLSRVHPDDREPVQQQIERARRDGEGFSFEHRLQLPSGSIKHVRVTAHPSGDCAGNLEFGSGMDSSVNPERASVFGTPPAQFDRLPAAQDELGPRLTNANRRNSFHVSSNADTTA